MDASSGGGGGGGGGNETAAAAAPFLLPAWLAESKPARNFWAFLVQQPIVDPITRANIPSWVFLPLALVLLLAYAASPSSPASGGGGGPESLRHKRRARARRRRRALWRRLLSGEWLWSLPLYSVVFAYVAIATSETAVSCGFLRLPPKVSEADWFGNARKAMRGLLILIKATDAAIALFSLAFSDPVLDRVLGAISSTSPPEVAMTTATTAPLDLRWPVAAVTACQALLGLASYLSVVLSALLLFASVLVWMTSGLPWLIYSKGIYSKLSRSFLGRYLNNQIKDFFVSHEFVRVGEDFRTLVLPFTVCAFLTQINLLLCSWHLLLRTRSRLDRFSLFRTLDLQLRVARLMERVRARRQRRALASEVAGGGTPLPATAAAVMPSVHEGLHAAATRAKTRLRQRQRQRQRKKEREREKMTGQVTQ